jgi:hypothetical protein
MPEADFSDGSALQDLVIKAVSYSFAFLRSELTKVQTLRSLAQLQDLDEDEEINQAVDDVISNFFINRGTGSKSLVGVTLVLSQKVDIFLNTNVSFNRDGTHIFYPYELYNIDKELLIERINTAGITTYEYDINLIAADIGTEYNVPPGNFLSWDRFNQYVTSVRNDQAASGGAPLEDNDTYINRSNEAITVRNLINPRSIRTVLLEKFTSIGLKDVTTIGYGDPEMLRDAINTYVTWTDINIAHIGNHQDIYCNLSLLEDQTFSGVTSTNVYLGEPDRPGSLKLPQYPVYKIQSVKDTNTEADLPYHLFIRDQKLYYTVEQDAYIILDSGQDGVEVTVTYDTVSGFDVIHNYLRDPDERVTLANSLARAVIPAYVEVSIGYIPITGQPALDVAAATQTVIDYINKLSNSDTLPIDSLIKELHALYGNYVILQNPIILKGTVYYPNGTILEFFSENTLSVPEYPALGVTNRTCGFFTSARYITFTQMA